MSGVRGDDMESTSRRIRQVTEEIVHTKIRYLMEHTGHGPEGYRTYAIDDMIIIRLLKVLTRVEYEQARTPEGQRAIKESRARMTQDLRPSMEQLFKDLVEAKVVSIHTDVSTKTGERLTTFVLDRKIADLQE
jgi:uncharacterized protein YbcI